MTEEREQSDNADDFRITVEGSSVEAIAAALDLEPIGPEDEGAEPEHPPELQPVLETLSDVYRGVEIATEHDSRGRSRKMVREYAEREDLDSNAVGHLLRVLEAEDLVRQDGNRWRIADPDQD